VLPDQKLLTPCSGTAVSIGKSGRSPAVQCRMTCKLKSLFTLSLSLFPLTHKFVRGRVNFLRIWYVWYRLVLKICLEH